MRSLNLHLFITRERFRNDRNFDLNNLFTIVGDMEISSVNRPDRVESDCTTYLPLLVDSLTQRTRRPLQSEECRHLVNRCRTNFIQCCCCCCPLLSLATEVPQPSLGTRRRWPPTKRSSGQTQGQGSKRVENPYSYNVQLREAITPVLWNIEPWRLRVA